MCLYLAQTADASPHHYWPTSVADMLSNICSLKPSPRLLETYAHQWSLGRTWSNQWKNMSLVLNGPPCMLHGPLQTGLADVGASRGYVCNVFLTSNYLMQPSTYRMRGNMNPAGLARSFRSVAVKNLARRNWTTKNRSWDGVVTLCTPPTCLLADVLCSRYLSQALMMTVWCTPSTAPTWRKVAPCCTIHTALHNSASLNWN
jgi:hypothetical protein